MLLFIFLLLLSFKDWKKENAGASFPWAWQKAFENKLKLTGDVRAFETQNILVKCIKT